MEEQENFNSRDKRSFIRVDHNKELNFKLLLGDVFKPKTDITSRNLSATGLLFRTSLVSSIPPISGVVWVELDDEMMNVCSSQEKNLVINKGGVFGRVVRIAEGDPGKSYDIGVRFLIKTEMPASEIEVLMASLN